MASRACGGRPVITVSEPSRSTRTGKREKAARAVSEAQAAAVRGRVCAAAESPVAWPAARKKYCMRSARRGPR
eukprot:334183-Lingulodinium_polyedra.AAC.1